jgi:hypothetical protein
MLDPRKCDGKQRYILGNDFPYFSTAFGAITVPAGLETDFASIPGFLESYISSESPVIAWPALVHDHLYAVLGRLPLRTLTRAECDSVLREAMLACGARATQAAVVHRAVRLFGGSHWKSP